MQVDVTVENVLFLCDSVEKHIATMHAILRRCLELETRSTLETSFEIKVDQKQRVLLLLACFSFSSYKRSAAARDQIAPNRCPGCKQTHPPTYLPTWNGLDAITERLWKLEKALLIWCSQYEISSNPVQPPTHPPTEKPTSRPSRTSCAIPGSMAGCSLRCQPDPRASDKDSFSICLR